MKRFSAWADDAEEWLEQVTNWLGGHLFLACTLAVLAIALVILGLQAWPPLSAWLVTSRVGGTIAPAADPDPRPPGREAYDRALQWWKRQGGPDPFARPPLAFAAGTGWATDGDPRFPVGEKGDQRALPWAFYQCLKVTPIPELPGRVYGTWGLVLDPWPAEYREKARPKPELEAPPK